MTQMRDYDQLIGMKKGKITVLGLVAIQSTTKSPAKWTWLCECDCGAIITRVASSLTNERNDSPCCIKCRAPYGTKVRNHAYWMR